MKGEGREIEKTQEEREQKGINKTNKTGQYLKAFVMCVVRLFNKMNENCTHPKH